MNASGLTPELARRMAAGARADPVAWVQKQFGFQPWAKQAEVLESVRDNRVTAVRSCHAIGKSTIAAAATLWFLSVYPRSLVLTTATSYRQVHGILWREVHGLVRRAAKKGFPIGGDLAGSKLRMADDWYAWGFTAKDYDATTFQGFHAPYILVIVDEAAGVLPTVFEGLDSAMASGHARMLMIGNPTDGSGDFGQAFKRGGVSKIIVSAFETPNFATFGVTLEDIRQGHEMESGPWKDKVTGPLPYPQLISPMWVREKWLQWCGGRVEGENDPRWQSRVLARFPDAGDRALVPLWWVEQANERWEEIQAETSWGNRCRVAVDVARFGDDSTERCFFYEGIGVKELRTAPKQDTMVTCGMVLKDVDDLEAAGISVSRVRIDADGLGAGVFDRLHEQRGDLIEEVRNGTRAQDPDRYFNRRSEMFFHLRDELDPHGERPIALPPDPELTRQLCAIQWTLDSRGKMKVESKDDIKERIGRSPDKADAVAYAVCRSSDGDVGTIVPVLTGGYNEWSDA